MLIEETGKLGPVTEGRPAWDTYFMDITVLVAKRSTCTRRAVGAVVVNDKRILTTGYNGAPSGVRHCGEVGCLRDPPRRGAQGS